MTFYDRASVSSALALVVLAISSPALAQQAGLQIVVVDADSGAPVAGAQVIIENAGIGLRRVERSDDQGLVRLEGLATGGSFTVSSPASQSYQASVAGPVSLRANFTRSITLPLTRVGDDALVVTASRAVTAINSVNAEISASLSSEALRRLPVEGRDVFGALVRLPNVVPSTGFFPEAPSISINGSNGLDSQYLIDGLDNGENFLGGAKFPVPLGFARDVTVLANSYSVAYGRTTNGVVNVTSPSGSNDLRGEVYGLVRPGRPFDARSAFPRRDLSGNPVGESFERYQGGFSVGGPLVRDRTFFYANLELTRDRNSQIVDAPALGTVANVTGNNSFVLGSLRLDHRLTDDITLGLRGNVGRVTIDRPGGALGGGNVTFPSAGSDQDRFSTIVAGTISYSGDIWSYDGAVQFSRFRWDYGQPKGAAGPQVSIQDPSGLTVGVVGHPGFVFNDLEQSWQTTHRLQRRVGNHRLSFGADLMRSTFDLLGGGNPDGNFTVRLTGAQLASLSGRGLDLTAGDVLALNPAVVNYAVELRPQSFGTSQTQVAFYLEDEWQVSPRLTATFGVRWDYDSLTGKGPDDGATDNVAPRLSLNYRPDARSAIRFGAGLFYGRLSYAVISDALQRNTTSPGFVAQLGQLQARGLIPAGVSISDVTFDGNLTVSPSCATVNACPTPQAVQALRGTATLGEGRILNPNGYESPYSVQLSAGYQYQATDTLSLSADVIYSRTHNLVRLRDLNAPAPFTPNLASLTAANIALLRSLPDAASRFALARTLGLVRSQADADATRPVALLPGGARQITVSETEGNATYRAINLQVIKERGDDAYALRLSYTLSKLTNDTDDINFRASDANSFALDRGPSANDRRHVLSAVATIFPVDGLTLSVAGLFQSGQPINFVPDAGIFGTQDLNGDGASFGENFVGNSDRYPGVRRNEGRLPWSSSVDIGMRYVVPGLGSLSPLGGGLELSVDVFNLFNSNNESGFANAATTSNQVQFGGGAPFIQRNAGPPRQFQFGAAWKF